MTYTRYFGNVYTDEHVARDAHKIMSKAKSAGIITRGPLGNNAPHIKDDVIIFNGNGDEQLAYDTFRLDAEKGQPNRLMFCKTDARPYDAVVVAILLAAFVRGNGMFSSDGYYDDEPTLAGIELFEHSIRSLSDKEWDVIVETLGKTPMPVEFMMNA